MIYEFPFDKLDWKVGSKRALHAGHVYQSTIPIWQMLKNGGYVPLRYTQLGLSAKPVG